MEEQLAQLLCRASLFADDAPCEAGEVALGLWDEAEQFMAKSGRGADRIHRLRQPSNPNGCEGFDPLLGEPACFLPPAPNHTLSR